MNKFKKISPIIAYIMLFAPLAFIVLFSFPTYDDFDLYYYMRGQWSLPEAFRITGWFWRNWSGDWLATFGQMTLNPLLFFSYDSLGYGIEMLIFTALFFGVFLFFAYTLMGVVCGIEDKPLLHWCVLALTAPFVVGFAYYEIYCWFDGFCYGMYMMFLLLAFAFIVRYFYSENVVCLVFATIFGCLNCVNLPTCVPIGLLYLYIWWNEPLDRGHRRIRHLVPLFLYILVALTNVAAPGNFSRQGTTGESLNLVKAFLNAGYFCVRRGLEILSNWPVLMGFVVLFMLGILVGTRVTSEVTHPHRLILLMMFGIFGAIFPVSLGYSSWRMPNRIEFIYDCLFMLSVGFCLFVVGQFLGERIRIAENTYFKISLGFVVAASVVVLVMSESSPWTKAVLKPYSVLAERQANINILNQLADNEPDEDGWVVATSESITGNGVYSYVGLTTDGEWPAGTMAYYFGKENARVEWKD